MRKSLAEVTTFSIGPPHYCLPHQQKSWVGSGQGGADPRDRQIVELKREIARRDEVIGELTIADRILGKVSEGQL